MFITSSSPLSDSQEVSSPSKRGPKATIQTKEPSTPVKSVNNPATEQVTKATNDLSQLLYFPNHSRGFKVQRFAQIDKWHSAELLNSLFQVPHHALCACLTC